MGALDSATVATPSWRRFSESPDSPRGGLFDLVANFLASKAVFIAVEARWRPLPIIGGGIAMALLALFAYNVSRLAPMRLAGCLGAHRAPHRPYSHGFPVPRLRTGSRRNVLRLGDDWTYFDKLGPAPTSKPKFKLPALVNRPIHKPNATGEELAKDLKAQIERVMERRPARGVNVIAHRQEQS